MKDFVPFEIAEKLKEKGYPQEEKSTIAIKDEVGSRLLSFLTGVFMILGIASFIDIKKKIIHLQH
jgi:hypothetical protein